MYIRSCVKTLQRYCMSRKKTNRADRISPRPRFRSTRQAIGYSSRTKRQVNVIWSSAQNTKNTHSVRPKLMRHWTFLEKRKRYFGTLTLVKMPALPVRAVMPWLVDSLKKENTRLPQKR